MTSMCKRHVVVVAAGGAASVYYVQLATLLHWFQVY